jgi:hypothetical protein
MNNQISVPDVERLLDCLAVTGGATATTMAALLGTPVPDALWRELSHQPGVSQEHDDLTLEPSLALQRLAALERSDGPRYRQLHQVAIDRLAQQLRAGDALQEATLFNVFKRLADHMLAERGVGNFEALVTSAQSGLARTKATEAGLTIIKAQAS